MTRSKWNGFLTLIAALGLGSAGSHLHAQTAPAKERFVTVTVADAKVRCKVLLTWKLPAGGDAFQVKAVESGDMLTIVRDATNDPGRAEADIRVYRWRDPETPHVSAPLPPPAITIEAKEGAPVVAMPSDLAH